VELTTLEQNIEFVKDDLKPALSDLKERERRHKSSHCPRVAFRRVKPCSQPQDIEVFEDHLKSMLANW
jgi:hypothetical protein